MLTFGDFHQGAGWEQLAGKRVARTAIGPYDDYTGIAIDEIRVVELYQARRSDPSAYIPFPLGAVLVVKEVEL